MIEKIIADKYRIIKLLGRGGMGGVYKAEHMKLGREEALKILHPELVVDPSFVQRFMREARAMARLDHENIIRVYDVFEHNSQYFIAMELFEGRPVNAVVKQEGLLPLAVSLNVIAQAAHGLAEAHAQGIVHRDVKPGNIMMNAAHKVKITDFGIAAAVDEAGLTMTGQLVGSPRYMSPEQARGEALDHRSDLYSLGMVFYELVTGGTPFNGDSGVVIIGKLAYQTEEIQLNFPAEVPEGIRQLIRQLLFRNPAARIHDANELSRRIAGLQSALQLVDTEQVETAVLSYPNSQTGISPAMDQTQTIPPKKPKRRAIAGAGVAALVAMGAGIYIYNTYSHWNLETSSIEVAKPMGIAAAKDLTNEVDELRSELDAQQLDIEMEQQKAIDGNAPQWAKDTYDAATRSMSQAAELISAANTLYQANDMQQTKSRLIAAKKYLNDAQQNFTDAGQAAKQYQIVEDILAQLEQWRGAAVEKKQQAKKAKGTLPFNDSYRTAVDYEKQADDFTIKTEDFAKQHSFEQSRQAAEHAQKAYHSAAQHFEKAELAFERQRLLNQINTRYDALRRRQLKVLGAKDKAEQAKASEYAKALYDKALDLNNSLTEESLAIGRLRDKAQYNQAASRLENAISLAQLTETAYTEAANSATGMKKVSLAAAKPSVNDIETVEQLLFKFERAYETRNLEELKKLALISDVQINTLKRIFDQYQTIDVSIKSYSLNGQLASAEIQIDKLVNFQGDEVVPGDTWRNSHLEIKKGSDGWRKITWQ